MRLKRMLSRFLAIVVTVIPCVAHSQISITNVTEMTKLKQGTTFFAMKDSASAKVAPFIEVIQKNWTISKVAFIKYSEVEKNIAPNNSFVTITGSMTRKSAVGIGGEGIPDFSNTRLFLEFWTTNGKFIYKPNSRKHFDDNDKIQLASIDLFTDFDMLVNPSTLYRIDYDAMGHIRNWGPGILTNYIQCLNTYLNKAKERKLYDETLSKEELKTLTVDTLFVPNYVLTKFNKFTGDESEKHDEKELFSEYSLKYQLLSNADLNTKILTAEKPFYYLLYVKSNGDKFVSVINSATGNILYSAYTSGSYNIKSSDLKELQKAIQKK